ncbi:uncharacterized protein DUF1120 [Cupriavidus agavae]|uniref:Uncharacterized protein DUF1120 n=2 Tax=Cupriavidus agavae TaxID=1001822 RepID=A0A4Q7RJ77_9BURK|nr:uncharacterized protein DUF1120 [Cupriavidus agavae]
MNHLLRLGITATLAWSATTHCTASETHDLSLGGVIHPTACEISLNPGAVDYGTVSASYLSDTELTPLAARPFDVVVSCEQPILTSLSFHDNRDGTTGHSSMSDATWFGLGQFDGKPIGAFQIVRTPTEIVADGNRIHTIELNPSGTWLQMNAEFPQVSSRSGYRLSWAETGTVPWPFSTIRVPMAVKPTMLARKDMPDLTDAVPMDGMVTITLRYM